MSSPIQGNILVDPALQQEIMQRISAAKLFANQPANVVDPLGKIELEGREVAVFLRHAVDAILLDDAGQVVLITRRHNPGAGLEALPGGFIDGVRDASGNLRIEEAKSAALRETVEETGIAQDILAAAHVTPVGARSYLRPFDIREAWGDIDGTPIRKGDLFAVSTQGFRVRVRGDLSTIPMAASDDASNVRIARIKTLRPGQFAVPDHLPMILEAASLQPTAALAPA